MDSEAPWNANRALINCVKAPNMHVARKHTSVHWRSIQLTFLKIRNSRAYLEDLVLLLTPSQSLDTAEILSKDRNYAPLLAQDHPTELPSPVLPCLKSTQKRLNLRYEAFFITLKTIPLCLAKVFCYLN